MLYLTDLNALIHLLSFRTPIQEKNKTFGLVHITCVLLKSGRSSIVTSGSSNNNSRATLEEFIVVRSLVKVE